MRTISAIMDHWIIRTGSAACLGLFIILAAMGPGRVQAQADTVSLEDENIDIIKDFEPVVQRANKKHFVPELPEIRTAKPSYDNYDLRISYREVDYKPSELKPLSFAQQEDIPPLPFAYLKAGFGNYLTPLIDFQVSNKNTEKFRIGVGLEHLSSKRDKIENQRFSETDVNVLGEGYFKGMTLGAQPYFNMHTYYLYGYDQEDTSFTADQTRNRYTGGGVDFFFFNHEDNALDLDYNTRMGFHSIKDGYGNSEVNFHWTIGMSHKFRELITVGGRAMMDVTSLKSVVDQGRFALGLNPYVEIGKERWQIRAGLWLLTDDGNFYALPDIHHQTKLFKDFIVIYNEWTGHLEMNSLRTLSAENPFLSENIMYNNFRIEERNFVGFKGNVPVGLDYDTRFAQLVYYDAPLFVNDTSVFRTFNVSYDDRIRTWNAHASIGYSYSDFLQVRASFDYFNYNPEDNLEAWHLPSFKTNLSATYHFDNKLILKADIFLFSGVKVLNADGSVDKLKGTVDLNFQANYHLNKYIAFFAQVTNAMSLKHKRFNHYPGYGFIAMGGLILSF